MKKVFLILLLAGASGNLFAGRYKELRTGKVDIEASTKADQIPTAIKRALVGRGWKILDTKKGEIKAKLMIRDHSCTILVTYDKNQITLDYVSSKNLGYQVKKGKRLIHRNYNNWIVNLEKDISVFLIE